MPLNKKFAFLRILLWVVGLIILSILSFNFVNELQLVSSQSFNPIPVLWAKQIILVIFGFYTSLIFINKWKLNFNPPLFWCAAIPCMVLSFAYPLTATPDLAIGSYLIFLLYKIHSFNVFGIVAGLTLSLSLFSSNRE